MTNAQRWGKMNRSPDGIFQYSSRPVGRRAESDLTSGPPSHLREDQANTVRAHHGARP